MLTPIPRKETASDGLLLPAWHGVRTITTITTQGGEYEGDRTILNFIQALIDIEDGLLKDDSTATAIKDHAAAAVQKHMHMTDKHREWLAAAERHKHRGGTAGVWNPADHPGCLLVGALYLNPVPGRFFIQAQGKASARNLAPRMANLSHAVTHLSFQRLGALAAASGSVVPPNYESTIHPLDGVSEAHTPSFWLIFMSDEKPALDMALFLISFHPIATRHHLAFRNNQKEYVTHQLHQAYHHYIKLVSTNQNYYQVVQNSQLAFYPTDRVPEAKFVLDISPIAVTYRLRRRREWYEYVTSLLAIVGGTFTVLGMLDSVFYLFASRQRRRKSMQQQQRHVTGGRSAP